MSFIKASGVNKLIKYPEIQLSELAKPQRSGTTSPMFFPLVVVFGVHILPVPSGKDIGCQVVLSQGHIPSSIARVYKYGFTAEPT